jgi:3-mercaptopyruvate sulfurtransferase SseA
MRRLLLALATTVLLAVAHPAVAGHPWLPGLLTIDPESLQRLTVARSIPLSKLVTRRHEVPEASLVVLYGAAGLEEAATAYRYLRAGGHGNVFVLEGGFAAWQAQGFGVER